MPARAKTPPTSIATVEADLRALDPRDAKAVIPALVKLWRATWNPRVGRLLESFGAANAGPLEDLPLKKTERSLELARLARDAGDAARSSVLQSFEAFARDATGGLVWPAVEAWGDIEPDPRVARMALRTLVSLEHQLTGKLWRRLVGCVERHGDRGVKDEARPYLALLTTKGGGWGFSVERFTNVLEKLALKRPPVDVDPTVLERLDEVARENPSPGPNREDASMMLAAIVAHPDDDTPRAVFADWLTERRDPRGEFIALQLARTQRKATPEERRREAALLASHRQALLGPFDGLVGKTGLVFERGFLVEATALTELPVHPLTRLLRSVHFKKDVGDGVDLGGLEEAHGPRPRANTPSLPALAPRLRRWSFDVIDWPVALAAFENASLDELRLEGVGRWGALPLAEVLNTTLRTGCAKGLSRLTLELVNFRADTLSRVTLPSRLGVLRIGGPSLGWLEFTRTADAWALEATVEGYNPDRTAQLFKAVLQGLGLKCDSRVTSNGVQHERSGGLLRAVLEPFSRSLEWVVS
ncbi:MAG: TIGR02996 domain-containing protein [Myxococcales bacterium]|nr:TIGR02996 domain-containing protein [Myxococcales bacterium]